MIPEPSFVRLTVCDGKPSTYRTIRIERAAVREVGDCPLGTIEVGHSDAEFHATVTMRDGTRYIANESPTKTAERVWPRRQSCRECGRVLE